MEERAVWKNRFLTLCFTLFFATPILAPLASADGMSTCDGVPGFSDCDDYDSNDNCEEFAVVWKEYHGELQVEQIYNHDTGEIYWEDNFDDVDTPSGRDWNPNDEILYCSILMWGELEQTIG